MICQFLSLDEQCSEKECLSTTISVYPTRLFTSEVTLTALPALQDFI